MASKSILAPSVASAQFKALQAPALTETSHSAGVRKSLIGFILLPGPMILAEYLSKCPR